MTSSNAWLTVLILAGGSLREKQLGPAPALSQHPADLADGSGLARNRIALHYLNQSEEVFVQILYDQGPNKPRPNISDELINPLLITPQACVISSIRKALPHIQTPWLLIIPITTLPSGTIAKQSRIELGDTAIPRENWSAVYQPKSPQPIFLGKAQPPEPNEAPAHPFTGVICAPTTDIEDVIDRPITTHEENDLLFLAKQLHLEHQAEFHFTTWRDLGHRATYSLSRLSQLSSRSFNQVTYEPQGDLISKCSTDPIRLQNEYNYLNALPQRVRRYFPTLISTELRHNKNHKVKLELEYIPFPNLAELFLHWKIGSNSWIQISRRLNLIRSALLHSEQKCAKSTEADLQWLYSRKLEQRLSQLSSTPPATYESSGIAWSQFWNEPIKLTLKGPTQSDKILLRSPRDNSQALLKDLAPHENAKPLRRIHGDLCFNNILAEPLSGSIRLIDPRGEQPTGAHWPIGFGDNRYDLIKILHSSRYLYDVVVNGLFTLKKTSTSFQLQLDIPRQYAEANQAIREHLIQDQLSAEEERLLTASLFFSMLPLHRNEPLHCIAFTCIGSLILERQFDRVITTCQS